MRIRNTSAHPTLFTLVAFTVLATLLIATAHASSIDSFINPSTSNVEVVDSVLLSGDYEIRQVIDLGQGNYETTFLTANSDDEFEPRLVIEPDGTVRVVYGTERWRGGGTDGGRYFADSRDGGGNDAEGEAISRIVPGDFQDCCFDFDHCFADQLAGVERQY